MLLVFSPDVEAAQTLGSRPLQTMRSGILIMITDFAMMHSGEGIGAGNATVVYGAVDQPVVTALHAADHLAFQKGEGIG
jgi:hypothetical protein